MASATPSHLLSEADLSVLAPGDLVQRNDGDWFEVVETYPASRSPSGVLLVGFYAKMVGAPHVGWQDKLQGPSQVADTGQWNGTPRERVQFQPAPAPEPVAPIVVPAAILAGIPLVDALRASLLADLSTDWEREAASSRRMANASPHTKQAWEFHASAFEQAARNLRQVLAFTEAGR